MIKGGGSPRFAVFTLYNPLVLGMLGAVARPAYLPALTLLSYGSWSFTYPSTIHEIEGEAASESYVWIFFDVSSSNKGNKNTPTSKWENAE